MKEYENSDDLVTKKNIQFLPVDVLNVWKLSKEDSHEYKENLKVKLILPINDNGCCNIFTRWKAKSVFHLTDRKTHPKIVIIINTLNLP
jgi:hypothetical protein